MAVFENEKTWASAVLNNSTDEFDRKFDQAIDMVKKDFGKRYPMIIGGKEIYSDNQFQVRSPADTRIVIATFPLATKEDTLHAIDSAKDAFSRWSQIPYQKRVEIFRECANTLSSDKFQLAAIMTFENGKNRLESMGDVDEAIDFLRFYSDQLESNQGFSKETKSVSTNEKTRSVLKPYGLWGIISPFNFPSAIAIGMTTGALITGNSAVLKPSSDTPLSAFKFVESIYHKLPPAALNFVTGAGSVVGKTILESSLVDGIAFTGSKEVGMSGFEAFVKKQPRPFISEMGGKNPAIITESADLEKAAEGVLRASFGYGGQKCSACSRVYVQKNIANQFMEKLVLKAKSLKIGYPWQKDVFLGPVINEAAVKKFQRASDVAKKDGKVVFGGSVLKDSDYQHGYFVEPTIVTDLPQGHDLITEELFLPFVCVISFDSFDEGIKMANKTNYGLTAGIFSKDQKEIEAFFEKIEAGVTYANRAASATTGAMVGAQPFVGWKESGISGKGAGGAYYLLQFMREQTQTRCE
ncbi:MAG: aldehyde dehydrogenase family protein [Nitrosopumilales archaeon]|nr:MAG: aldehyde dehydrogenase family protein [Nitrosopumilales archaeon]